MVGRALRSEQPASVGGLELEIHLEAAVVRRMRIPPRALVAVDAEPLALVRRFSAFALAATSRWDQSRKTHSRYARLRMRLALSVYGVGRLSITRSQRQVSSRCAAIPRSRPVISARIASRSRAVAPCCRAVACGTRATATAASTASRQAYLNAGFSFGFQGDSYCERVTHVGAREEERRGRSAVWLLGVRAQCIPGRLRGVGA